MRILVYLCWFYFAQVFYLLCSSCTRVTKETRKFNYRDLHLLGKHLNCSSTRFCSVTRHGAKWVVLVNVCEEFIELGNKERLGLYFPTRRISSFIQFNKVKFLHFSREIGLQIIDWEFKVHVQFVHWYFIFLKLISQN